MNNVQYSFMIVYWPVNIIFFTGLFTGLFTGQ